MLVGFLNDELRDWIAVAGLALALFQTWLAIKSARPAAGNLAKPAAPSVRYPTRLRIAIISLGTGAVILIIGGACMLAQIANPGRTDAELSRQLMVIQRVTFAYVSGWAVTYLIGSGALLGRSKDADSFSRPWRLVGYLTHSLAVAVLLAAVVSVFVATADRVNPQARVAAALFAIWVLPWIMVVDVFYIGAVSSSER